MWRNRPVSQKSCFIEKPLENNEQSGTHHFLKVVFHGEFTRTQRQIDEPQISESGVSLTNHWKTTKINETQPQINETPLSESCVSSTNRWKTTDIDEIQLSESRVSSHNKWETANNQGHTTF